MMNPVRRASPDSEAMASSEDERPWPSQMSFGKFPMKENSVPGIGRGIWTQRSGSFALSEASHRNAIRDVRLGAVNATHTALRAGNTPSPSTSDGANSLPFAIPLQPTPKTGRSLSHSQGQREVLQTSGSQSNTGGHAAVLPLGLLTEEDDADTESESELGSKLTHTTSHSLMRTTTLPAAYGHQGLSPNTHAALLRGRAFEHAFAGLNVGDAQPRRSQWQSHLGWDDVPMINESRRHSLADIPTRRGSLVAGEHSHLNRIFNQEAIEDEPNHYPGFAVERQIDPTSDRHTTRALDAAGNIIPAMYRVPHVELSAREHSEIDARREQQQAAGPSQWGSNGGGRPRKQLYIVSFKCSRVDVFYLLDNTGLRVREGDMVIVEADRGQDLGTVQHAKVTPDAARLLKKKYSEEQYKWLMMYSRNKDGGYNPNAQVHGESSVSGQLFPDAPATMQGTIPRDNFNNLKPKAIKRLANDHEIKMLAEKEGNEAKAKRTCQQKVAHLRLQMEILDAEWQWDFQKLIFYYYADHYINFKDLITELYRIYKTRIWLSAINPASFSQHAMGQPPSGIGPGAVPPYNPYALNNSYTMTYGEDRDPYGAQMPYRIPYETYTPNYPAIPGVANSFAPSGFPNGNSYMFYGPGSVDPSAAATTPTDASAEEVTPTAHSYASLSRPGSMTDYGLFYDRMATSNGQPATAGGRNLPGMAVQSTAPPAQLASYPHGDGTFLRSDGLGRRVDGRVHMSPTADHSALWSFIPQTAPSTGGLGRQGVLPNPIGTARPTSQGNDFRGYGDESTPSQGKGKSAVLNGNGNGVHVFAQQPAVQRDLESNDAAASRAHNINRYFANLPSPADMRAADMSRER